VLYPFRIISKEGVLRGTSLERYVSLHYSCVALALYLDLQTKRKKKRKKRKEKNKKKRKEKKRKIDKKM
jgi:hypothetical protein